MSIIEIVVISIALAMDAFSVSIASGSLYAKPKIEHAFRMAFAFGLFQAVMPVLGWLAGVKLKNFIGNFDHWAAFILLSFIGVKMIYEAVKIKQAQKKNNPINTATLLLLALATSIDAFAVGITFSFLLASSLALAVIIIGVITFGFSFSGFYIGKTLGHFFENRIEILGGAILIAIGTKILIQHLLY